MIASMASRSNSKPSIEMRSALKSSMVLAPPRAAMTFASAFCSSKNDLPRRTGVTSASLSTALSASAASSAKAAPSLSPISATSLTPVCSRRNSAAWRIRRDRGFGRAGAAAVAERIAATGIVETERWRAPGGETIRENAPTLMSSQRLIARSRAKHDAATAAGRLMQPSKTAPKSDGRHADQSVLHQNSMPPGSAAAHSNRATLNRDGSAVPI